MTWESAATSLTLRDRRMGAVTVDLPPRHQMRSIDAAAAWRLPPARVCAWPSPGARGWRSPVVRGGWVRQCAAAPCPISISASRVSTPPSPSGGRWACLSHRLVHYPTATTGRGRYSHNLPPLPSPPPPSPQRPTDAPAGESPSVCLPRGHPCSRFAGRRRGARAVGGSTPPPTYGHNPLLFQRTPSP